MESQNKLFDQFKTAAEQDEQEVFPMQERLWARVEAQLEEQPKKRALMVPAVRYIAASVVILLGIGLVWQLNREEQPQKEHSSVAKHNESREFSNSTHTVYKDSVTPKDKNVAGTKTVPSLISPVPQSKPEVVSPVPQQKTNTDTNTAVVKVQEAEKGPVQVYRGLIKDQEGNPVMGALVYTTGDNSVQTEIDGVFQIEASDTTPIFVAYGKVRQEINKKDLLSNHTIVLQNSATEGIHRTNSTTGTNGQAIVAGGDQPFKAAMEPKSGGLSTSSATQQELESVTVYGQKLDKRSYVGAINTVSSSEIQKRPVTNIASALDGAAPGVLVTSGGGQPGSNPDIMIRGQGSLSASTAPLIIVDGAPYTGSLVTINPNDVDNMVILKDATTKSLYGARAANGVIVITTKGNVKNHRLDGNLYDEVFRKNKTDNEENDYVDLEQQVNELLATKPLKQVDVSNESYDVFEENKFEHPLNNPLSTFSIDVDRASYANVRRFITSGSSVPKDAVRIEEMINYFGYNYPQPQAGSPFSINTEYSVAPWNRKHQLLKIGLQGRTIPEDKIPASNLVFLIDVSGSMNEPNKLPYVVESMKMLTMKLRKQDRVAIVVYAGAAGLVLPSTSGDDKETILSAIYSLSAGGSTAGGQGISLAYKIAKQNFIPHGNNRIILATDGDFNVGMSDDRSMQDLIEEKRKDNIYLTCLGFGSGNYKDSKMEILADKGNGNYAYIDNMSEAAKILQREFNGTMFAIAKDVKIQIEFNPAYVQSYRLIGYENRKLNAEDFANDAVDAGELGSGHTVTALYEIIPTGITDPFAVKPESLKYSRLIKDSASSFMDELAQIKFRYKEPNETKSKLIVQNISRDMKPLDQTSKDFKLASTVAWFGLKLRDSKLVPDKDTKSLLPFAKEAIDKENEEQTELLQLIEAVK